MLPHLIVISVLGAALLLSTRIVFGRTNRDRSSVIVTGLTITGWVLIFVGIAFAGSPVVLVVGLVIAAMVVARWRVSERQVMLWTMALAAERGLPLHQAARAVAMSGMGENSLRAATLADLLEKGLRLSEALRRSKNRLPYELEMAVAIGESNGSLPVTLRSAVDEDWSHQMRMRRAVVDWLYVVVALQYAVLVMLFVCWKVLPTVEQLWSDFEVTTPPMVQAAYQWGAIVGRHGGWLVLPLVLIDALFFVEVLRYMGVRVAPLRFWRFRGVGSESSTVIRILSHCLTLGRSLPESLSLMAEEGRGASRYTLEYVAKKISAGADPWKALIDARVIHRDDLAFVRAASRVGNLPWALKHLAEMKSRAAQERARLRSQLMSTLMLLLIGVSVAFLSVVTWLPLVALIRNLSQ